MGNSLGISYQASLTARPLPCYDKSEYRSERRMVVRKQALALSLVLGLLVGCASSTPAGRPVTMEEASAFLDELVQTTLTGDLERLCGSLASTDPSCEVLLAHHGKRLPTTQPQLLCSYELSTRQEEGFTALGGRVLVLAGIDGAGKQYETELLIFQDGKELRAINAVWWSGMGIGVTEVLGGATTASTEEAQRSKAERCKERQGAAAPLG